MGNQLVMHVASQLEPPQHLMLGFIGIRTLNLIVRFGGVSRDQRVGAEGLEFYPVSPGGSGNFDQFTRQSKIPIMVHARLRDDQGFQVDLFKVGIEVPVSQLASRPCAMPTMQRAPMLTPCRTVELLPTKVPSPMCTPPLITVAVAM